MLAEALEDDIENWNHQVEGDKAAPDPLNVPLPKQPHRGVRRRRDVDADDRQRVIDNKAHQPGWWLAMDTCTRQGIAFQSGDHRQASASESGRKIPLSYRAPATCWTDADQAYQRMIPEARHQAIRQKARQTHPNERLNGTLRQRLSSWVRSALAFSKKPANHLGAIRSFLSD
ncbi:MAG TPA: IS1 family transposase [Candidatus Competibacteraceae bacterium]|nr:IS1 family transposase [Candidatus Competibacteraceae bacterium]